MLIVMNIAEAIFTTHTTLQYIYLQFPSHSPVSSQPVVSSSKQATNETAEARSYHACIQNIIKQRHNSNCTSNEHDQRKISPKK